MHIIVCIKQIVDPECALGGFRVDEVAKRVIPPQGTPLVVSPFDIQAAEAALRIRDKLGECKISILSMGPDSVREAVKQCLAMGADEGIILSDAAFEGADSYSTARALVEAIKKIGDYDLILTGRQAADVDCGIVGIGIGELLGVPVVTFAKDVTVQGRAVRIESVLDDGSETIEAPLPAVVTVSNQLGEPRYPKLKQLLQAARKQVTVWSAVDLGLDVSAVGAAGARLELEQLFVPVRTNRCEFIAGDSPQELSAHLIEKLKEFNIL